MLAPILIALAAATIVVSDAVIDPGLASALFSGETSSIIVSFSGTKNVLSKYQDKEITNREEHITALVADMQQNALDSQQGVVTLLALLNIPCDILWITNEIFIREADPGLVNTLATTPNVTEIHPDRQISLITPIVGSDATADPPWGIGAIHTKEAWEYLKGFQLNECRIGNIDTGVKYDHEALKDNFYGMPNGWKSYLTGQSSLPIKVDGHGHGTHTMGTMAGSNGIGVAPMAKWMACQALDAAGMGQESQLKQCAQYVVCFDRDPVKNYCISVNVVSNSWGGGQNNIFFDDVIKCWHCAGIIPVFAIGNSGSGCSTANSPGDSIAGVIAVGATTQESAVASYSSRGPTNSIDKRQKPDIAAPGDKIKSAYNLGDNSYKILSGTSMACPHVAGVVCLLLSINKTLKYKDVVDILTKTTNKNVIFDGQNCGEKNASSFPNFAYGYGIVNAFEAVKAVKIVTS